MSSFLKDYQKVMNVTRSCTSYEHLKSAEKYRHLFLYKHTPKNQEYQDNLQRIFMEQLKQIANTKS